METNKQTNHDRSGNDEGEIKIISRENASKMPFTYKESER